MPTQIQKSRLFAFKQQQGRCFYCRKSTWLPGRAQGSEPELVDRKYDPCLRCTAEHLIARKDGGKAGRANIVAACWYCNQQRHRTLDPLVPSEYVQSVRNQLHAGRWHQLNVPGFFSQRKEQSVLVPATPISK